MYRSKQDVDLHVSSVLSKIHSETEKNLRGFNFARLYFQVKDWESAKKYLSGHLSVRDHHAPSHKLMAQIHYATKNIEKALQSFKRSLELDQKQTDIVLKICELYCMLPVDHETARYWADRADQLFPHNDIVFRLRECLVSSEGEPDRQELEKLIIAELQSQPYNLSLRVKLVKLYLDAERIQEAYGYIVKIEKKRPFPTSTEWYYLLEEVFQAYQDEPGQELDASFYINFLTALDRLVFLTVAEPHAVNEAAQQSGTSIADAALVLQQFDRQLKKASDVQCLKEGSCAFFLHHMKGQLYMHLGSLVIKKARKDMGNWKDACHIGAALFLFGYTFKPSNILQEVWFLQMEEQQKIFTRFYHEGAMRTSFMGHSIISLCNEDDKSKWLMKIKQDICLRQVRERTYNRLFGVSTQRNNGTESYFLNDSSFDDTSLEFPSFSCLLEYDKSSYKLHPGTLHYLLWLHLQRKDHDIRAFQESLHEVFKGLQFSNSNLSRGSPESLCLIDIEAYLIAVLYTTRMYLEQKTALKTHQSGCPLFMPPHIADQLCTIEQDNWWRSAYSLVNNTVKERLGDQRRILQRGLEVIRGIGIHGLEIQLVVHLARVFADKAAALNQDHESSHLPENGNKKANQNKVPGLEFRAKHYWNIALSMLDTLGANRTLRLPKDRMFHGYSKSLSTEEISALKEEGRLYLACRLVDAGDLDQAAPILEELMSPYASYQLAVVFKKMAEQQPETNNLRTIFLQKSKDAVFATMDRIKGENTHPLNEDIYILIEEIESEMANSCDSTEIIEDDIDASPIPSRIGPKISTPIGVSRHFHSSPKYKSTPVTSRAKLDNGYRNHLEPSPERLDAQIRSLAMTQSTLVKTVLELQKSILDTNKALIDGQKHNTEVMLELKKQLEELSLRPRARNQRGSVKKSSVSKAHGDNEEDEFTDYENDFLDYYIDGNVDGFHHQHPQSYNYNHHRVLNDRVGAMNYVPSPSGLPTAPPPTMAHYGYQYPPPPHPAMPPPTAGMPETNPYYAQAIGHGLPFSEGQQLPNFHFQMGSAIGKPPMLNNVAALPQPASNVHPAQAQSPSIWTKQGPVPHNFQIPLPTAPINPNISQQPTGLSVPQPFNASSSAGLSPATYMNPVTSVAPSRLDFFSAVPNLPVAPLSNSTPQSLVGFSFADASVSAITPEANRSNRSRQDSDVYSDTDIEREVIGDFKPVIPLPAEVITETGEEDESVIFEERAKLFRFVDREWKERGIGKIKILKHESDGRIRLLMRRDQVLKICANHLILPSMEITPLKNSDKALTWAAQDFADESVKPEQFCVRFKTADIAAEFKKAFESAVMCAKITTEKISSPAVPASTNSFSSLAHLKPSGWTCSTCYVNNHINSMSCIACEASKPIAISEIQSSGKTGIDTVYKLSGQKVELLSNTAVSSNNIFSASNTSVPAVTTKSTEMPKPVFGGFNFLATNTTPKSDDAKSEKAKPQFSAFSFTADAKPEKSQDNIDDKPVSTIGGFTFSTAPVFAEKEDDSKEREILVVTTKSKDGPQVTKVDASKSPFSGFSFKALPDLQTESEKPKSEFSSFNFKPDPNKSLFGSISNLQSSNGTKSEIATDGSVFGSGSLFSNLSFSSLSGEKNTFKNSEPQNSFESGAPLFVTVNKDGRRVSGEFGQESTPEEFVPTAEFQPVIPLPAIVDVATGEENSEKVFGQRVRLFRYNADTKEWKERGIGELKILKEEDGQKYRILMRRDQVLKICANHYILPEMKLSPLSSSDKSWVWMAQDFSDMELKQEQFAARFKNVSIAQDFFNVFEKCKTDSLEKIQSNKENVAVSPNGQSNAKTESNTDPCIGNSNLLSNLFKPAPESWECQSCYVRNEKILSVCKACQSIKPGTFTIPLENTAVTQADQWECKSCNTFNHAGDTQCNVCKFSKYSNDLKPLSEFCKVDPASWECQICYVRNDSSRDACVACESYKPGAGPKTAATSTVFGKFDFKASNTLSSGFVFGSKESPSQPRFQFGSFPTASNTAGFIPDLSAKPEEADAVFGGKSLTSGKGFSATPGSKKGIPIPAVTAAPTFVFGKPATTNAATPSTTLNQQTNAFMFGTNATPESEETVEFKFGSPQKYEFNFSGVRPRSPPKSSKSPRTPGTPTDAEDDEEVEPSDVDNIYFQPVIPLPPKVDVKTGEEDETVLFTKRAKLFRFTSGEWKERGIGDLKILLNTKQNRLRLLMRRDQVLKVCLNHYLTKDLEFTWRNNKSLSWAASDFSEGEPMPEQFAIRFKLPECATEFHDALQSALKLAASPTETPKSSDSGVLKEQISHNNVRRSLDFSSDAISPTEEKKNDPHNDKLSSFSFTLDKSKPGSPGSPFSLATRFGAASTSDPNASFGASSSFFGNASERIAPLSSDIDVVYEATATPEQIAAAEKLMLPPNFYLYENKPPCPGCRGCEDGKALTPKTKEIAQPKAVNVVKPLEAAATSESPAAVFPHSSLSVFSFADVAAKSSGFDALADTSPSSKASFPGVGAPVFGQANVSRNEDDSDEVAQGPDVHFAPVIALPDLVDVKTGEEDEVVMFSQRAKLYRFDPPSKQWKERGVGELKILQHKEKCRFRVLHRREQVHKVACNHVIAANMELNPMSTSDNSLCWSAVDYSEGKPESSQFAVRFKNKDILMEFKSIFEEAKSILSNNTSIDSTADNVSKDETSIENISTPTSTSNVIPPVDPSSSAALNFFAGRTARVKGVVRQASQDIVEADDDDEDFEPVIVNESDDEYEDDDDADEEEEDLVYSEYVTLEVMNEKFNRYEVTGRGQIQVVYDDSVYGYRVIVIADEYTLCDHIIAIQSCLRTDPQAYQATWAAFDISIEPPARRQFRAAFPSRDSVDEFGRVFEEGKEMAVQAEIVEKADNVNLFPSSDGN